MPDGGVSSRVSKRCNRMVAQFFQRLRKFWVFERKNAQFIKFLPFFGPFCNFLRKTFGQKFWARKKKMLLESLVCRGRSVAVAVCVSDRWQATWDM